jgi:hypothetical protein
VETIQRQREFSDFSLCSPLGFVLLIGINTHRLIEQESDDGTRHGGGEEDPEHIGCTNTGLELVEHERRQDGTALARSGGETVGGGADTGGERFSGDDESGGIGTKVEEELQESEARQEGTLSDVVDFTGQDSKEERGHEEATELEPLAANDIDGEEGNVVPWQETEGSDDELWISG